MKKLILPVIALMSAMTSTAQDYETSAADSWRFGVTAGYHGSWLNYTNLDKNLFPENKQIGSGVFSFFIEKEFGPEGNFAIRPEIALLRRGGNLNHILDYDSYYMDNGLADISYRIKAGYADLRLPLIWRMGNSASALRPYLFVVPVLGFCTGGNINYHTEYVPGSDPSYDGVRLDVTKANMSQTYFAGAVGAGVNWYFQVNDSHRFFFGLEADYEHGFTNTYGHDNSAAIKIPVGSSDGMVEGKRRYRGFEVRLTFGVPFTVFSNGGRHVNEDVDFDGSVPIPEVQEPVAPPHDHCYTIDEIADMMAHGKSIDGKTICAIDDIVTFDFGKSTITPDSYPWLNRLAEMLKRANAYVCVSGHTDDVGDEDYNMRLSRDRAIAVYNYLINRGVPVNKLSYAYYGESDPIATNETEEGRRINRRVEFIINSTSN